MGMASIPNQFFYRIEQFPSMISPTKVSRNRGSAKVEDIDNPIAARRHNTRGGLGPLGRRSAQVLPKDPRIQRPPRVLGRAIPKEVNQSRMCSNNFSQRIARDSGNTRWSQSHKEENAPKACKHRCVLLQSSFVIMSDEDPKPGTSKDSTSFMDFDDVVEEGNDDHHQSNASIVTPYKLDARYYTKLDL